MASLVTTSLHSLLEIGVDRIQDESSINVLTCGDGDLSYSLALANNLKEKQTVQSGNGINNNIKMMATCFLEGDELMKTHPEADSNQREIESLDCEVRTGVDATKLHETFELKHFHRIVWNFPQHPERRKIHLHRQLLKDFFESAGQCLRDDGEIWVTLKGGQGGSKGELLEFIRPWANTWQIQEQAALSGLVLASVTEANIDKLEKAGYRSVGFRGSDRSFFTKGSLTHIFTLPQQLRNVSENGLIQHPLIYRHDISFWIEKEKFKEENFKSFLNKILKPKHISFNIEMFDEYTCPKSLRFSRGYHVDLWSTTHVLSKPITGFVMKEVSISLQDGFDDSNKTLNNNGATSGGGANGRYQYDLLPDHCKLKKSKQETSAEEQETN